MSLFFTSFIQRLERIFKTDMRYALSGGFFLALAQITSAIVALGLTIAFANLLPPETYGTYRYILAVYAILAIAALPGLDTAVLQSVARGHDSALKTGIKTKFRWGLVGTVVSFIYAGYHYAQGSFIMGHIFILVGIALPLMESLSLYTSFLNGKKLFRTWTAIEIGTQLISISSLIGVMLITKNIVALLVGYFFPYIVVRVLATIYVQRRHAQESAHDPGMLSYGRSMTAVQVISRLFSSADQIALYHFLGPAQVAIYSLATAIPNRIQSMFRITGILSFPKFATRTNTEITESLPRKMFIFAVSIMIICAVYVAAAPLVFNYIFPKYLPSLPFSRVAVFFTLSAVMYPFSSYLLAHKKIKENYIIVIASFVTKVGCLVVLIPLLGIWGAVIGLLASSVVNIAISLWLIFHERSTVVTDVN